MNIQISHCHSYIDQMSHHNRPSIHSPLIEPSNLSKSLNVVFIYFRGHRVIKLHYVLFLIPKAYFISSIIYSYVYSYSSICVVQPNLNLKSVKKQKTPQFKLNILCLRLADSGMDQFCPQSESYLKFLELSEMLIQNKILNWKDIYYCQRNIVNEHTRTTIKSL